MKSKLVLLFLVALSISGCGSSDSGKEGLMTLEGKFACPYFNMVK